MMHIFLIPLALIPWILRPECCCAESRANSRKSVPRLHRPFSKTAPTEPYRAMASAFSGLFRRKMLATLSE
jgi:hypothetical protein